MTLAEFNKTLKRCPEAELNTFVQKHLFHGIPVLFTGREEEYFDFRDKVANNFGISYHEVFVIGSAKQGFSYIHDRDTFDLNSDVDVAIVNEQLFEKFGKIIREYQYSLQGGTITQTRREYNKYIRLLQYFVKGWIRPDLAKLLIKNDKLVGDWDTFFISLSYGKSEVGNYKVAAGVFKSYDYLQRYHYQGLKNYLEKLKAT